MQFLVEEALLVRHDVDVLEAERVRQERDAVAAAEAKVKEKLDRMQGRL